MAAFPSDQEFDHKAYIRSTHWKKRRALYYQGHDRKCGICGSHEAIELHHHHYRNLGNERDEDLTPLCQFHHYLVHVFAESANISLEFSLDSVKLFLKLLDLQHLAIGRYASM
jgi:hypothetical protein